MADSATAPRHTVRVETIRSGPRKRAWPTRWWAIAVGYLMLAFPGALLLWFRSGTKAWVKVAGTIAVLPLLSLYGALLPSAPAASANVEPVGKPAATREASASALPAPTASDPATASSLSESTSAAADASAGGLPDASANTPARSAQSPGSTNAAGLAGWPYSKVPALDALDQLTVKGRAPKTGYDRALFGSGWVDIDKNGCDTRNDVLAAQLNRVVTAGPCKVTGGTLDDPYTGKVITFVPGSGTTVQIDHLVALSDAWQKGAQNWEWAKRVAFANDPLNLLAVDASTNESKGDGDTATWLPPNKRFRCEYVARQEAVKLKYGAWVTDAELTAMRRVLETCPGQLLPAPGDQATVAANTGGAEPKPKATGTPEPAATPNAATASTDPRFDTCKEAKAHGYGPYVKGTDPEYDWYRDGDKDGIDCE